MLTFIFAGKPVWLKYSEQGEAMGVARGPTSAAGTGVLVMGGPLLRLCSAVLGERTCPLLSGSHRALQCVGGGHLDFGGWVGQPALQFLHCSWRK